MREGLLPVLELLELEDTLNQGPGERSFGVDAPGSNEGRETLIRHLLSAQSLLDAWPYERRPCIFVKGPRLKPRLCS